MRAGVVGLGDMGSGLAKNLISNGFKTAGFDLSETRMAALEALGGSPASNVAEVGERCDAVFVMVMNGDQLLWQRWQEALDVRRVVEPWRLICHCPNRSGPTTPLWHLPQFSESSERPIRRGSETCWLPGPWHISHATADRSALWGKSAR